MGHVSPRRNQNDVLGSRCRSSRAPRTRSDVRGPETETTRVQRTELTRSWPAMGTTARVTVVMDVGTVDPAIFLDRAERHVALLEDLWSRSYETRLLVRNATDAWRDTSGWFDPTVYDALIASGYDRTFDRISMAAALHRARYSNVRGRHRWGGRTTSLTSRRGASRAHRSSVRASSPRLLRRQRSTGPQHVPVCRRARSSAPDSAA